MTKSYHPSKEKRGKKPYLRLIWLLDMKQVITDIARKEADLDTLKAGASLIPAGKVIKLPKVIKAIGNVGKTGFKKGKEGEKIAKSNQAKQTKARDKGGGSGAVEENRASDLPIIEPGSKEWDNAVKNIKSGGSTSYRTRTATDAKGLLNESRGNMDRYL